MVSSSGRYYMEEAAKVYDESGYDGDRLVDIYLDYETGLVVFDVDKYEAWLDRKESKSA